MYILVIFDNSIIVLLNIFMLKRLYILTEKSTFLNCILYFSFGYTLNHLPLLPRILKVISIKNIKL